MITFGIIENMDKMRSVKGFLIFIMIVTLIHPALNKTMNQNDGYADLVFKMVQFTVDENRSWAEATIKNGIILC